MAPPEVLYLLTFPIVGAVIGWFTNFLAIKMLFRPQKPVRLLGYTLQGLLPRRRKELAEKIGETVSRDLLSEVEISALLGDIHWEEEVKEILKDIIRRDLVPRTMHKIPGIDLVLEHLNQRITQRILRALHENTGRIVSRFRRELDLRGMVVQKVTGLDFDELEKMVFKLVARELRHIELVGGLLGFLVGLSQSAIFYLTRSGGF